MLKRPQNWSRAKAGGLSTARKVQEQAKRHSQEALKFVVVPKRKIQEPGREEDYEIAIHRETPSPAEVAANQVSWQEVVEKVRCMANV